MTRVRRHPMKTRRGGVTVRREHFRQLPRGVIAPAVGAPTLIALAGGETIVLRGPKADVSMYLRTADGDADYTIYPAGQAPNPELEDTDFDEYERIKEELGTDGGTFELNTEGDIRAFERTINEITGLTVSFVVDKNRMKADAMFRNFLGLPPESED